MVAPRHTVEE